MVHPPTAWRLQRHRPRARTHPLRLPNTSRRGRGCSSRVTMPGGASISRQRHDYRDLLTSEEQATLDDFRARIPVPTQPGSADGSLIAPGPEMALGNPPAPAEGQDSAHFTAANLVTQARQAMATGDADEARRLAEQARSMGAGFGDDEDSPEARPGRSQRLRPCRGVVRPLSATNPRPAGSCGKLAKRSPRVATTMPSNSSPRFER